MRDAIAILAIIVVSAVTVFSAGRPTLKANAAPAQPVPIVAGKLATCDPIALAGNVVIYFCEPDNGPSFYVNSVGFMFIEQ